MSLQSLNDRLEQRVTEEYFIENFDDCMFWIESTGGRIIILDDAGQESVVMISADEARYLGIIGDEDVTTSTD